MIGGGRIVPAGGLVEGQEASIDNDSFRDARRQRVRKSILLLVFWQAEATDKRWVWVEGGARAV